MFIRNRYTSTEMGIFSVCQVVMRTVWKKSLLPNNCTVITVGKSKIPGFTTKFNEFYQLLLASTSQSDHACIKSM